MLSFKIEKGKGTFVPANAKEAGRLENVIRDLAATVNNGETDIPEALAIVKGLIAEHALFLKGYPVLAELLGDEGDEAEGAYIDGCRAALKLIPSDFKGPLDVENEDVQCFLRCHTGYVESLKVKGQHQAAIEAVRRQLIFDPGDMFQREQELAELHIMDGQYDEARLILEAQAKNRPTALYSLAYLDFMAEKYAEAASRLRQAFLLAPYAVDFITGRVSSPNLFWQAGPRAPEFQEDLLYVESLGGEIWVSDPEALVFIEWLSQTSAAMGDRAAMVAISEKSFGKDEPGAAEADAFMALWQKVGASADDLVKMVPNPQTGEMEYPWVLLGAYHDLLTEEQDCYEHGDDCGCGCGESKH